MKAVILSVVKLAETLTVCFPLYANGNGTHLHISVLVAKLMKELGWSFPKLLHKRTDSKEVCEQRLKTASIYFIWI